jgi:hypothetical protein
MILLAMGGNRKYQGLVSGTGGLFRELGKFVLVATIPFSIRSLSLPVQIPSVGRALLSVDSTFGH